MNVPFAIYSYRTCLPESPIEQHKERGVCMQIKIKGHTNQEKGYTSLQALNCSI